MADIEVTTEWREATLEGNYLCPLCGGILILIPTIPSVIAFCPACKKYFIATGPDLAGDYNGTKKR